MTSEKWRYIKDKVGLEVFVVLVVTREYRVLCEGTKSMLLDFPP